MQHSAEKLKFFLDTLLEFEIIWTRISRVIRLQIPTINPLPIYIPEKSRISFFEKSISMRKIWHKVI